MTNNLQYTRKYFNPDGDLVHRFAIISTATPIPPAANQPRAADDSHVYVFTEEIVLAVNVALATGRPILVSGAPGTGKSTLARHVAKILGRRFYEYDVTSRTQARDLLYDLDLVQRLHDAQALARPVPDGSGGAKQELFDRSLQRYVRPRVLWWAFSPETAREWEARAIRTGPANVKDPCDLTGDPGQPAVVLLDEIDKADPDVPNNLLVPLGALRFSVDETGDSVESPKDKAPLVILTTNRERELPKAFLRRCVELHLPDPTEERLLDIAEKHFFEYKRAELKKILEALIGASPRQADEVAKYPSPAEFVDTLHAAAPLKISASGTPAAWKSLVGITVYKSNTQSSNA